MGKTPCKSRSHFIKSTTVEDDEGKDSSSKVRTKQVVVCEFDFVFICCTYDCFDRCLLDLKFAFLVLR